MVADRIARAAGLRVEAAVFERTLASGGNVPLRGTETDLTAFAEYARRATA